MAKTDKQIIITISREYGSGGKEIGEKLAQRLGINFYDKKLIEEAAKAEGIPKNAFNTIESGNLLPFASGYTPETDDVEHYRQAQVIIALAAKEESFVIVGRCADYVLRGYANVSNVFITAPLESRIARVRDEYGEQADNYRAYLTKKDKNRIAYYNYFADDAWGKVQTYDISVNSDIGIDRSADLIAQYIREKYHL